VNLAISKEKKNELVAQYQEWATSSRAFVVTEYTGLTTTNLDEIRRQAREAGGEFHIVKNTLTKLALDSSGYPLPEEFFVGSTAIGYAFEDAPAIAKVLNEFSKSTDFMKIKGGYLGKIYMTPEQVRSLAELPPLPVVRARLLGVLSTPASQLARIIAEPARQVAQVIKAHSDQEGAAA
jgi:large subunit ribosomal protein L10